MTGRRQQTFVYPAFKKERTIRILQIIASPVLDAPISCVLKAVHLDGSQPFDCLSYTWRDPLYYGVSGGHPKDAATEPSSIFCNGETLVLPPDSLNLIDVLLEFRRRSNYVSGTGDWIWIDAICINQPDMEEKHGQIDLMGDIYDKARAVIIWLGPEDQHTDDAMEIMARLKSIPLERLNTKFYDVDEDLRFGRFSQVMALGDDLSLPVWRNYAAFLHRQWFSRAWVVQEAFFARQIKVLCGKCDILWEDLVACSRLLQATNMDRLLNEDLSSFIPESYSTNITNNQLIFTSLGQKYEGSISLEGLLSRIRYFDALNPEDVVYAVRGIWLSQPNANSKAQRNTWLINPRTRPAAEVFTCATYLAILETGDLDILRIARGFSSSRVTSLPSWVPDYDDGPSMTEIAPREKGPRTRRWNASGSFTLQVDRLALGDRYLTVQGFKVDIIESLAPTLSEILDDHKLSDLLRILANYPAAEYPQGASYFEAFWRTLLKDTYCGEPADVEAREAFGSWIALRLWSMSDALDDDELPQKEINDIKNLLSATRELVSDLAKNGMNTEVIPDLQEVDTVNGIAQRDDDDSPRKARLDRLADEFRNSFETTYSGRRLFRSRNGYFGITSAQVQPGDSVVVIAGAIAPYVLRPGNEKRSAWHLVGEAYVHGIMRGEAVQTLEALDDILLG